MKRYNFNANLNHAVTGQIRFTILTLTMWEPDLSRNRNLCHQWVLGNGLICIEDPPFPLASLYILRYNGTEPPLGPNARVTNKPSANVVMRRADPLMGDEMVPAFQHFKG